MSTHGKDYYGDDADQENRYGNNHVNDSISIGNYLWLATANGVIRINQTTRKQIDYNTENSDIPADEVESIAANQKDIVWIGTYGRQAAFMNEDEKWEAVPYTLDLFEEGTTEDDGKILLGGDKENWLRTNFIHFDINDTLWVGTSVGLLKLQYDDEKPVWKGPFNPADVEEPLNVLFIKDVERGLEISGNFGKKGYEEPIGEVKTYILPNIISDTDWQKK